jgi:hypothetical protein
MAHTQNFIWNKVYGSSQSDVLSGLVSSGSGKYYYSFSKSLDLRKQENAKLKINDTMFYSNKISSDWLVKFDTSGHLVWGKEIFYPRSLGNLKMISDEFDCIYFLFDINNPKTNDSFKILQNSNYLKIDSGIHVTFIVKLNSKGDLIWQKEIKNVISGFDLNLIDQYLYFFVRNRINKSFQFLNDSIRGDFSLIKLDTSGAFIDFFNIGENKNNFQPNSVVFKIKDSIIIMGVTTSIPFIIGNQKINNITGFFNIIKIVINEKNKLDNRIQLLTKLNSNKGVTLNTVFMIDENKFGLAGSFRDSLIFLNSEKLISKNNNTVHFLTIIKNKKVLSKFNFESNDRFYGGQFLISEFRNGNIYLGGPVYGSFNYFNEISKRASGLNIFCKFDSLCNLLWYVRTGDSMKFFMPQGFVIDKYKGIYFGSSFEDSIKLNNRYYNSDTVNKRDFVISKIYDFSITRGVVSKGPYCAGDTILIPYSKDGQFQAQNEFIAELSDENGEFDGLGVLYSADGNRFRLECFRRR